MISRLRSWHMKCSVRRRPTSNSESLMKTLIATFCLTLVAACGGQMDLDDSNEADVSAAVSSFDPLSALTVAQQHAAKYSNNPQPVGLMGKSTDGVKFTWAWTFQDNNHVYVTVSVSPTSTRVTDRGVRAYFMGMGVIDPKAVTVDANDAVSLLAMAKDVAATLLHLTAPLAEKL